MAVDKKISQLASGAPAQAGDEYVVARSGANYKLTLTNIAASMPATTITSGNLTFSSTAQRITGDMSNATVASRLAFQTSTTNGSTVVHALPNGTATGAFFEANNGSDPTNAATMQIGVDGVLSARINAGIRGTGTYLPMTFNTGGSERVRIDTSGNVGIGGTANAQARVNVTGTLPTDINRSRSFFVNATIPSGTTANAINFYSLPSTENASFTLTDLYHFFAVQGTKGASSTITNQYGFSADSSLTGATNNYGFHSNIASGSNRWNFYAAGTAQNYFAGNTGVGVAGGINGARLSVSSGTANATTYKVFATQGGSTVQYQQQKTTSVSTSATIILTPGDGPFAGLALVFGHDGSGNRFIDLVMFSVGTGTVNVINSLTASGTPAARTYSQGSSAYQLAMASGTYTVEVMIIGMGS